MSYPEGKRFVGDVCGHYPHAGMPRDHFATCDCPIMIVGEAPGRREDERGEPFIGPAGRLLNRDLLAASGLDRSLCYITNVLPWQPPGNDVSSVPASILQKANRIVRNKIQRFTGKIIVPLGNTALLAVSERSGIMKWRGSVLSVYGKWSVASIHPAAMLRSPALIKTALYDWGRIKGIIDNGWTEPTYTLVTTVWNDKRLESLRAARVLSCDIETVRGTSKVLCISFCGDGRISYSVDTRKGIPPIVRELLESRTPKIFQNGLFDTYILACNDIKVRAFEWDTSLMFHALDNNAGPVTSASSDAGKSVIKPYSLAYMASIFSPLPYWKDSGKDDNTGEAAGAYKSNWQRFSEYNALDALGTYIIAKELKRRLKNARRLDFYKTQYARLLYPILDLSLRGVRFDAGGARERATRLRAESESLRGRAESLAGRPLRAVKVFKKEPKVKEGRKDGLYIKCVERNNDGNVEKTWIGEKKSISNTILQKYLYDPPARGGLGLKRQTKDGHTTSDEVAIRNLLLYVKEGGYRGDRKRVEDFLNAILEFRETEKTIQFLGAGAVDDDGRIRASYGLNVQTGRLRSSGNPTGTGYNLQNVQRNVRHFFIPDEETWFFLELDLKQAEDLVVKTISAAITGDSRPLQLVQAVRDGSRDIHRGLASVVFGVPADDINYEQRYVTKRCRHGINNGMRSRRMQQTLLKDGFVYTIGEVERIFRVINDTEPWVSAFHQAIRRAVMRHAGVATSWGWQLVLDPRFERLNEPRTFNRAYCYIEQSEVGVLMKQGALLAYWNDVRPRYRARLNMLVHDNVVLSVPRDELYDVMSIMHASMTQERKYGIYHPSGCGCGMCGDTPTASLSIPAEIKISKRLSCTCDECDPKKNPAAVKPLELASLPARGKFEEMLAEWEKKNRSER